MKEKDVETLEKWTAIFQKIYKEIPDGFTATLDPDVVDLNMEEGWVVARFPMTKWAANPMYNVHGGIIASLVDTASGMLCKFLTDTLEGGPTVSMSVNYLRSVPLDSVVCVRAVCKKHGRTLLFTTCEGYLEDAPDKTLFTGECCYLCP